MLDIEFPCQSDPVLYVVELAWKRFECRLVDDRRPEELFVECSRLSSDHRNYRGRKLYSQHERSRVLSGWRVCLHEQM